MKNNELPIAQPIQQTQPWKYRALFIKSSIGVIATGGVILFISSKNPNKMRYLGYTAGALALAVGAAYVFVPNPFTGHPSRFYKWTHANSNKLKEPARAIVYGTDNPGLEQIVVAKTKLKT